VGFQAAPDGLGGGGPDAATLDGVLAEYGEAVDGRGATHCFVIIADDQPVGFIQWYRLGDAPTTRPRLGSPTAGVDLASGEPGAVGRGLGAQVIDRFVTDVVAAAGITRDRRGP
jgi:GNAT superfamily N-acetyltransferase